MWIWLTISLLLVIACIIFGIYSFIRSRSLQKTISAEPELKHSANKNNKIQPDFIKNNLPGLKKQSFVNLKMKLKSIEENSLLSAQFIKGLKKRIESLEAAGNFNPANEESRWEDAGEDWEKLYYESRKEKQSLEDNLNNIKDALQENMNKQREIENQQTSWAEMKSDLESRVNEVDSLQKIIEELQRKVKGGREREKQLVHESANEKSKYAGYEQIKKENNKLHSEIDMLTNRLDEINEQNGLMEKKIKSLTELGSVLEITGYDKLAIKKRVGN
jgi:chromosome segregation ATPase